MYPYEHIIQQKRSVTVLGYYSFCYHTDSSGFNATNSQVVPTTRNYQPACLADSFYSFSANHLSASIAAIHHVHADVIA